ncbi:CBS domain-containing protein [Microvirga massiliensis]|uniref:CBS domain-containing protein n=1 Tax=Microvirga massiliensis TaxID=1033741 RepID=UPI000699A84F|nr:CBS domain-containing protein [Microvirga massiliensis]
MKAGDVMTTGAATIRPEASLADAARIMLDNRISGLPVVDSAGKLVGIITERDFLRRGKDDARRWLDILLDEASGQDTADQLNDRRVADVMSTDPLTVSVETSVSEITELMERHNVRRIPVVANDKVAGIVSVTDLLLALMRKTNRISDRPA